MARTFTVILEPDDDQEGYTVVVPALPGCVTEGDTLAEALENARDAIRLCLEDMEAHGEPIPEGDIAVRIEKVAVEAGA